MLAKLSNDELEEVLENAIQAWSGGILSYLHEKKQIEDNGLSVTDQKNTLQA